MVALLSLPALLPASLGLHKASVESPEGRDADWGICAQADVRGEAQEGKSTGEGVGRATACGTSNRMWDIFPRV